MGVEFPPFSLQVRLELPLAPLLKAAPNGVSQLLRWFIIGFMGMKPNDW